MGITRPVGRIVGDIVLGAVGLLVGAAVFTVVSSAVAGGSETDLPEDPAIALVAPPAADSGESSPALAVSAFLDAELSDDVEAAHATFSEADRLRLPTPVMWATQRASILGDVQAWSWISEADMTTRVELAPGLSLTAGWTPSFVDIQWDTTLEDGWRISLQSSTLTPVLPNPADADQAAADWLTDDARCGGSQSASLVLASSSDAFKQLCATGGVPTGEPSIAVSGQTAVTLALAYGNDVSLWARTIRVEGGTELVLAAIGHQWIVIDAVAAG